MCFDFENGYQKPFLYETSSTSFKKLIQITNRPTVRNNANKRRGCRAKEEAWMGLLLGFIATQENINQSGKKRKMKKNSAP